jgi:hypothetical protein
MQPPRRCGNTVRSIFAIGLATLALQGVPTLVAVAQRPTFAGLWTLNNVQGDDPQGQKDACESTVRTSNTPNVPDMHSSGITLGTPITLTDEQRDRMEQTIELALDAPVSLTILQTPSTIAFAAEGDTLVLPTDGRKLKQTADGRGDVEVKTSIQGNDLVIQRKVDRGGTVTTEYLRSQDGKQLYMVVAFEGKCGHFQFRRVYDQGP